MPNLVKVRVTGILIEDSNILIVRQKVSETRTWSLPGGRLEEEENLDVAIERELLEETGLITKVQKLLYVCEVPDVKPALLHITFLMKRLGGEITLPTNEFDSNPITDVKMIPIIELIEYGFTEKFMNVVLNDFPGGGNYMGRKINIGL